MGNLIKDYKKVYSLEKKETNLKEGRFRAVINFAVSSVSKTEKEMITVEFLVSGCGKSLLKHYFVQSNYVNYYLTKFFNSFGIEEGNFNFSTWVGKEGGIVIEKKKYYELKEFLSRDEYEDLPPFEGELPKKIKGARDIGECLKEAEDEDLPF